jgi:hypothetical protein
MGAGPAGGTFSSVRSGYASKSVLDQGIFSLKRVATFERDALALLRHEFLAERGNR